MVTTMDPKLCKAFIPHILSDVAERRTDPGEYLPRGGRRWILVKGQRRRVFVHGDHVCYQQEQFHDSDSEHRLSMALAAAEIAEEARLDRSWGKGTKASIIVAEVLVRSGCKRLQRRFRDATPTIGSDGDPLPPTAEQLLRLGGTIRRQVRRYRAEHPNWKRDFELSIATFRADHFRDPGWYREAEERSLAWLSDFEKLTTVEWGEAGRIVVLARLYQQQHKFDLAAATFRKAILVAREALMHEDLRSVVILLLRSSVKACARKLRPVPDPWYVGPRLHTDTRRAEVSDNVPQRYSGFPYEGFRLPA